MGKRKMLSVEVDSELVQTIDSKIKQTKLYSSRSEFLKEAIRDNLFKMLTLEEKIDFSGKMLHDLAVSRGATFEPVTREERIKIANEYLKEKGFKTHPEQ